MSIAGHDGSTGGWVMVLCDERLRDAKAVFVEHLANLPRALRVAAVDVPIGLPDRGSREADTLARKLLGHPRGRSVFPCPIRPALGADTREEASARTERIDGRRISQQTWGIVRKIREADTLMRTDEWARGVVHEVHPELSFATGPAGR